MHRTDPVRATAGQDRRATSAPAGWITVAFNKEKVMDAARKFVDKGQIDKAVDTLQKAVDAEASDPVLREHLGEVYLKKNMPEAAKAQWGKSLELDPKNEELKKKYIDSGFGDVPKGSGQQKENHHTAPKKDNAGT